TYTEDNIIESASDNKGDQECFIRDYKVASINVTGPDGITGGSATILIENKKDALIDGFIFKFITDKEVLYAFKYKDQTSMLGGYIRNSYSFAPATKDVEDNNPFSAANAFNVSKVDIYPIITVKSDTKREVVCQSKLTTIESKDFT
ncbi:hypothetical protein COT47_03275, partial [Candidatus Woesearchaeota archaeon CG08_land_8_20_14_0_20_43_7]